MNHCYKVQTNLISAMSDFDASSVGPSVSQIGTHVSGSGVGNANHMSVTNPSKTASVKSRASTVDFDNEGKSGEERSIQVAIGQVKPAKSKWGGLDAAFDQLENLAKEAHEEGAELLVLPELYLGGYELECFGENSITSKGPEISKCQAFARRYQIALVFGFVEKSGKDYYDSVIAIEGGSGDVLTTYRKTHLHGEDEKKIFTAGNSLGDVFLINDIAFSLLICQEIQFPEAVRTCVLKGAEVVLCPSARFYGKKDTCLLNEFVIPVRGFENHLHIAFANWAGPHKNDDLIGMSCLVGPNGVPIMDCRPGREGIKTCQVKVKQPPTKHFVFTERKSDLYILD